MQLVNDILNTSVLPKLQGGNGGRIVGTLDTPSFLMNIPSFSNAQRQDSFQIGNPMGSSTGFQGQQVQRRNPPQGPQQPRRPGPGTTQRYGPPRPQQPMQQGPQTPMRRDNIGVDGYPPQRNLQRWQEEPAGPKPFNPLLLFFLFKSFKE